MSDKKSKSSVKRTLLAEQLLKAKNLFMEKQGDISDVQIARIVGVHRTTVAKWRVEGNWNALAQQVRQAADKKAAEKAAERAADQSNWVAEEVNTIIKLASYSARRMMILHDDHGRPIVDANGQPKMNPKLSASDLRSITSTMEAVQRMDRLEHGTSDPEGSKSAFRQRGRKCQRRKCF